MAYVKLFSEILDSTVWRLPSHGRLVWITMLAMSDRDGEVKASVPGLADRARVERVHCEQALAMLMAPDPDSRTPDHEGRRIEKIDGGWRLINHAKYREKMDAEEVKAKAAERQRKHRERKAMSRAVTESNACHAESRDVTPVTTSDHAQAQTISEEREISDAREATPQRRETLAEALGEPPKPAPSSAGALAAEKAREYVALAMTNRKAVPHRDCSQPMAPLWGTLASFAIKAAKMHGTTWDKILKATIRAWADDQAIVERGYPVSFLAANPNQYLGVAVKGGVL